MKNSSLVINEGQNAKLTAEGIYDNGNEEDVSDSLDYTSNNPEIANVDNSSLVTGIKCGRTIINAELNGITQVINVEVKKKIKIVKLVLSNSSIKLKKGKSIRVKAYAVYNDGTKIDITNKAVWTCNNIKIASYKNGNIKANSTGKCTVTVSYGNIRNKLVVAVIK